MTVLVTGASGFIGGRLIAELVRAPQLRVRAASRTARHWPVGVDGVITDFHCPASLATACEGADVVVHLASMSEAACAADPYGALQSNAGGTLALAMAATEAGVRRFVLLSTFKVYGNNPGGVVDEDTPTRPNSHYAITHRVAEDYALTQHASAVVLRLANGFGAPIGYDVESWRPLVNDFCRQASAHGRIAIRSDGRDSRNFVPMGDVISAIQAASGTIPAGTYNLGSTHAMTLRAMAEHVAIVCERALGFRPEVSVGPMSSGRRPDLLEYRTNRLRDAGVDDGASLDDELEATLRLAHALFGPRAA